ncbi:hypothetical protein Q1M64_06010 (plasmid) [Sinorhizobium meliloti]|nr:hypothetical protein Q1M64_06010 [Sinorhizobium meliloti]
MIAYYERHYPFAPPLLLRAAGDRRLPDTYRSQWQAELEQEGFDAAYRQFLHLNARFISNDVIGYFIELLDDFYVFDTHIDEFRRVLEQPARLGGWLTRPDRWQLLEGMASFYEFALDLDQYLAALEFPYAARARLAAFRLLVRQWRRADGGGGTVASECRGPRRRR